VVSGDDNASFLQIGDVGAIPLIIRHGAQEVMGYDGGEGRRRTQGEGSGSELDLDS
jgi:hypothetical protein